MNTESTTSKTRESTGISMFSTQTNTASKNTTVFTKPTISKSTYAFVSTNTKEGSPGILSITTPTTDTQSTAIPTTKSSDASLFTTTMVKRSTGMTFSSTMTTSKSIGSSSSSTRKTAMKTLSITATMSFPTTTTKLATTSNTPIVPDIRSKRVITTATTIPITAVARTIPVNMTVSALSSAEPVRSNAFLSVPLYIVFVPMGAVLTAMALIVGLMCYMHSKKTGTGAKGSDRIIDGRTSTRSYTSSFRVHGNNVSAFSTTRLFSKSGSDAPLTPVETV